MHDDWVSVHIRRVTLHHVRLQPPLVAHIRLQVRHRSSDRFARNMRSITKSGIDSAPLTQTQPETSLDPNPDPDPQS